jgi:hypothetical protein
MNFKTVRTFFNFDINARVFSHCRNHNSFVNDLFFFADAIFETKEYPDKQNGFYSV